MGDRRVGQAVLVVIGAVASVLTIAQAVQHQSLAGLLALVVLAEYAVIFVFARRVGRMMEYVTRFDPRNSRPVLAMEHRRDRIGRRIAFPVWCFVVVAVLVISAQN